MKMNKLDLDQLRAVSLLHQQIHREIAEANGTVEVVDVPSANRRSFVRREHRPYKQYRTGSRLNLCPRGPELKRSIFKKEPLPPKRVQLRLPGEVFSTEFVDAEAALAGVSKDAIWCRIRSGKYPGIKIRRVSHNFIFINPANMKRLPVGAGGPVNRTGVSSKDRAAYTRRWRELRAAKMKSGPSQKVTEETEA